MNRFNFFTRNGAGDTTTSPNDATTNPYSDVTPLSPGANNTTNHDIEAQPLPDQQQQQPQHEMAERPAATPGSRFIHRFRPAIPSWFTTSGETSASGAAALNTTMNNSNRNSRAGATAPSRRNSHHHANGFLGGFHFSGFGPFGFGGARPASSTYSGEGVRGAPGTVVNGDGPAAGVGRYRYSGWCKNNNNNYGALPSAKLEGDDHGYGTYEYYDDEYETEEEEESARGYGGFGRQGEGYGVDEGELNLPGERLEERQGGGDQIVEPTPAVVRAGRHDVRRRERERERAREREGRHHHRHRKHHKHRRHHRHDREHRRRRRGEEEEGSEGRSHRSEGHRSRRTRRDGEEGSSSSSSSSSRHGERRHRDHRHRHHHRRRHHGGGGSEKSSSTSRSRPPPSHFLFCFPWIESAKIRRKILQCFVSGMFVALTLSIYLTLTFTQPTSTEFTILMIVILALATLFFCHSLIRLVMLAVKERRKKRLRERGQLDDPRESHRDYYPEMAEAGAIPYGYDSQGYADPTQPIPMVIPSDDEEAAGAENEATKTGPPAYGVWRGSVRVDPQRMFWVRKEQVTTVHPGAGADIESAVASVSGVGSNLSTGEETLSSNTGVPRPPSYSSDDGVSYVLDARPRSIAPPPRVHQPQRGGIGVGGGWI
ncbi:hypothetical protein VTJ49DRAFT_5535 [Mycothermus thermophilus]|uniref:Uncharacterized protein n=1 Tax=Humicola insolens TaxID=85995 RepID=A0ABR3V319_HUMIN